MFANFWQGTLEHKDFPLSIIPSVHNPHFFKICIVPKGWDYRQGNALPLGCRARHFRNATPEQAFCHYCPGQVQTMRHFVFSCPLAQCLWQDFRSLFSLPHAVSLQQAAFSWSPQAQVLGRRYGFRLQAGHAVAVHYLESLLGRRDSELPICV